MLVPFDIFYNIKKSNSEKPNAKINKKHFVITKKKVLICSIVDNIIMYYI